VNDWPSSVKNLATLVRRIGPARVQLNTVSRPPAEPSALAPSLERMRALLSAFPGKVELISEEGQEALIVESLSGIEDGSILALLGRRPCTSEDVARGLGIHRMEALKALDQLTAVGQVKVTQVGGKTFYALGSQEEAQRRR
jgi:wyosine [tRNA(Phe)-imidazoG37] synthetase (radical SAM superfamily)